MNAGLSGYLQNLGYLSQVVVLGAGYLVPSDQILNSQAISGNDRRLGYGEGVVWV